MRLIELARLSDAAIETRLASCETEADRQQLLALRMERDIEGFIGKREPERQAELREAFRPALESHEHLKWIDPERVKSIKVDSVSPQQSNAAPIPRDPRYCQAPTKTGRPCNRGARIDGLCWAHAHGWPLNKHV